MLYICYNHYTMENQAQHAIRTNFVNLTQKLSIQSFLDELLQKDLLSIYDYNALAYLSPLKQNQLFFLHMNIYSNKVYKHFTEWLQFAAPELYKSIQSLRKTHLNLLFKPLFMTPESYHKNLKRFCDTIDVNIVAPIMFEKGYISAAQLEMILTRRSAEESTRHLLRFLDNFSNNIAFLADFEDALQRDDNTSILL